ncbi:hypothetical protein V5O48_009549 [Marasmius crinis-equi]|uniref:Ribonuclease H1 N-terminal domain-containing protein n=1 Tax=Marasmius crinis-equi TaxID=585013 RepID=A0ABR3FAS9_9AGAR
MVQLANTTPTNPSGTRNMSYNGPEVYSQTEHDVVRNATVTRVSIERHEGFIVTTTIKIEPISPRVTVQQTPQSGYVTDTSSSEDEAIDVDPPQGPPVPAPSEDPMTARHIVPVPTSYRRPALDKPSDKYYVVFGGLEVGIFGVAYETQVRALVDKVKACRFRKFDSWDEALWAYAAGYQGQYKWPLRILEFEQEVNPDSASYSYGKGTYVGKVDITGLDLEPRNLPVMMKITKPVYPCPHPPIKPRTQ